MIIGAVIVTFNRLNLLKELLDSYLLFDNTPDILLIVNNNSTDGTKEYLEKWKSEAARFEKHIINLAENIGGSGGFYEGIKFLLEKNCEWIWVCDDDAFPEKETFKILRNTVSFLDQDVVAISVAVVGEDGKYQLAHRRKIAKSFPFREEAVNEIFYNKPFEYDLFSYVGVLIKADTIRKAGLPERDFFIFYDDTEHSMRIRNFGRILCLPQIRIIHKQPIPINNSNWKNYYGIRNKLITLRRHYLLSFIVEVCFLYLKSKLKRILNYKTSSCELVEDAVLDALLNRKGKNIKYLPNILQKREAFSNHEHKQ